MERTDFDSLNARYAEHILTASKAEGVCLILVSKNYREGRASFIYQRGIPLPMVRGFTHDIFRCCPYIQVAADTLEGDRTFSDNRNFLEARQSGQAPRFSRYWQFLLESGIKETAACIRSASSSKLLVCGLLSSNEKRQLSLNRTLPAANDWLQESYPHLLDYCLTRSFFDHASNVPAQAESEEVHMSRREHQLISLLYEGNSNKEIADRLALSIYTVENYLRHIYRKFGVHSRASLIARLYHSTTHTTRE